MTADPHLLDAEPISDQVWEQVGPGWVLASYGLRWARLEDGTPGGPREPVDYFAIAPDGRRFRMFERQHHGARIINWKPGGSHALVRHNPSGGSSPWGAMDVRTGNIEETPFEMPDMATRTGVLADGTPVYSRWVDFERTDRWVIDGFALRELHLPEWDEAARRAEQAVSRPGDFWVIHVGSAWDEASVLVCGANLGAADRFDKAKAVRVWVDGSRRLEDVTPRVSDPGCALMSEMHVVAGHLVVPLTDLAAFDLRYEPGEIPTKDAVAVVVDGSTRRLPGVDGQLTSTDFNVSPTRSSGSSVYHWVSDKRNEHAHTEVLVRDDVVTGESVVLVPLPAAGRDERRLAFHHSFVVPTIGE